MKHVVPPDADILLLNAHPETEGTNLSLPVNLTLFTCMTPLKEGHAGWLRMTNIRQSLPVLYLTDHGVDFAHECGSFSLCQGRPVGPVMRHMTHKVRAYGAWPVAFQGPTKPEGGGGDMICAAVLAELAPEVFAVVHPATLPTDIKKDKGDNWSVVLRDKFFIDNLIMPKVPKIIGFSQAPAYNTLRQAVKAKMNAKVACPPSSPVGVTTESHDSRVPALPHLPPPRHAPQRHASVRGRLRLPVPRALRAPPPP